MFTVHKNVNCFFCSLSYSNPTPDNLSDVSNRHSLFILKGMFITAFITAAKKKWKQYIVHKWGKNHVIPSHEKLCNSFKRRS